MYKQSEKVTSQSISSQPSQNLFQSRPFAAPAEIDVSTTELKKPELQSGEKNLQRSSYNLADILMASSSNDPPVIQPKLAIGAVGDPYEQEADRVASQVVGEINEPNDKKILRRVGDEIAQRQKSLAPQSQEPFKPIHRFSEEAIAQRRARRENSAPQIQKRLIRPFNIKSQDQSVQRQEAIAGGTASADLESSIQGARGGGQALDANLQQSMGQAMGADFSGVKVHTDSQSDQLNKSIQAKAFTTGQDVFFRQGAYEPSSRGGQELIAHELTHVVQQNGGITVQRIIEPKRPDDPKRPDQIFSFKNAENLKEDLNKIATDSKAEKTRKFSLENFQSLAKTDDWEKNNLRDILSDLLENATEKATEDDKAKTAKKTKAINALIANDINSDPVKLNVEQLSKNLDALIKDTKESISRRSFIDKFKLNDLAPGNISKEIGARQDLKKSVNLKIDLTQKRQSDCKSKLITLDSRIIEAEKDFVEYQTSSTEELNKLQNDQNKFSSLKQEEAKGKNGPIVTANNIRKLDEALKKISERINEINKENTETEKSYETYITQLKELRKKLNEQIDQLEQLLKDLYLYKGDLEQDEERLKILLKYGQPIKELVNYIDGFAYNQFEVSWFTPKSDKIDEHLKKLGSVASELKTHIENYFSVNKREKADSGLVVRGSKDSEKIKFKEVLIASLIGIIEPHMKGKSLTAPQDIQYKDMQMPKPPDAKHAPKDLPETVLEKIVIPPPPPRPTERPVSCQDFFVKDRPVFIEKIKVLRNSNSDAITKQQFNDIVQSFDVAYIQNDSAYIKDPKVFLKDLLNQIIGNPFQDNLPVMVIGKENLVRFTHVLEDNSYSDLNALTKASMKKMEVDELANFQEGTIKSKQIQIGASGKVSVSVTDVLKVIPIPGLGESLQIIIKKLVGDGTLSGQVSFDGIAKMSALKDPSNQTTALNLDFIAKAGGEATAEIEGGMLLDGKSRSKGVSAASQLRISYNFMNEAQIKNFLNGERFREVGSIQYLVDKTYTISSTTEKIMTNKDINTKIENLKGIGLSRNATKKISDKKVQIGKNLTQRNAVKITDGDKLLSKLVLTSSLQEVGGKDQKIPQNVSLQLAFQTIEDAKKAKAIPAMAQHFSQDLNNIKGNININGQSIFESKITELSENAVGKIKQSLSDKPQNYIKETDLKILSLNSRSTDMVGFDMGFIPDGDKYNLAEPKYALRQKKGLGASVGLGDYFKVGVKGMSKEEKIIGTLNDVQQLPPGQKKAHLLNQITKGAEMAGNAIEGVENAMKLKEEQD